MCTTFSRAYLRHLCHSGEMLAGVLLSLHNVYFFQHLMARMRDAVRNGTFDELEQEYLVRFQAKVPLDAPTATWTYLIDDQRLGGDQFEFVSGDKFERCEGVGRFGGFEAGEFGRVGLGFRAQPRQPSGEEQ